MRKALTIGLAAAVLAATLSWVGADPAREPMAAADAISTPSYYRGPRIIHVPQPGDRNIRASLPNDDPEFNVDDDDDVVAPPPRRPAIKQAPARAATTPKPATGPRWKPRSSDAPPPPPPAGPRRAVLSAPPPATMGPPPQKDSQKDYDAEAGDKFGSQSDTTVATPAPPPGYAPPAGIPQAD